MKVRTEPVQWITPHTPDAELLAAIGEVVVRHVHLEHMLKMTIKSLLGITVDEALAQLSRKGSPQLRQKIEKEAMRRLDEGPALTQLQELLDRCRNASRMRNEIAKSVYAMHLSEPHIGLETVLGLDLNWYPVPSLKEVANLAKDIGSLADEITEVRLHGWLGEAIRATGNASR